MNYKVTHTAEGPNGHPGWVAIFDDDLHVFVDGGISDDPVVLDAMIRDTYEDSVDPDAAPTFRVYEEGGPTAGEIVERFLAGAE